MSQMPIRIWSEGTPNPNTLKFNLTSILMPDKTLEIKGKGEAKASPLAVSLFDEFPIESIFLGYNFLTVTRKEGGNVHELEGEISQKILDFINSGEKIVADGEVSSSTDSPCDQSDPTVQKIIKFLEEEIRPAVAMDGGDVLFHDFKEGVVTIHLQGACRGCPSSSMTLKMGIETRLKEEIPEVKEVLSI